MPLPYAKPRYPLDLMGLQRVAVVTGAAQGIGRRTAEVLGEKGYALVLTDLHACPETLDALKTTGVEATEVSGDIAEEETAQRVAQMAKERFGRVDVLVNNAGISHISPAEQISAADFRRVQEVNLLGPFLMCREVGRAMLEQ